MKKVYGIHLTCLLLFLFSGFPQQINAQVEESVPGMTTVLRSPGYIILSNDDTLYGEVRMALKYVENNPVQVKFFAENGKSKSFNASEIRGFGSQQKIWEEGYPEPIFLVHEDYVTLPSFKKGIPVFMHRLISGRLTVYQNRSAAIITATKINKDTRIDGIEFTFIPGEGLSIGPSYRTDYRILEQRTRFSSYFVSRENEPYIKVNKDNYDEIFSTLFGGCLAIDKEINTNPDLGKFKNFMILVEIYNRLCHF